MPIITTQAMICATHPPGRYYYCPRDFVAAMTDKRWTETKYPSRRDAAQAAERDGYTIWLG